MLLAVQIFFASAVNRYAMQNADKAEDAELRVCHAFTENIHLHTKPHKIYLPEHSGKKRIQQVLPFVNEIIGNHGHQNTEAAYFANSSVSAQLPVPKPPKRE